MTSAADSEKNVIVSSLMTKAFHRDLKLFITNPNTQRALVFPTVNTSSCTCLYSLVKDNYQNLTAFLVGAENEQRPVVSHLETVSDQTLKSSFEKSLNLERKDSLELLIIDKNEENCDFNNYDSLSNRGKARIQKRPDRAVYVPPRSNRRSDSGPQAQIIETAKDSSPVKPAQIPNYDNLPYYSDIEAILGPVILVSPHNDYLALETGSVTNSRNVDTDLPNIVELYDFPAEFKTDQLEECLHKNLKLVHYYDLKWVDDTHALAIFTDVDTADKALNIIDPYIKFRPFWSASNQSKTKARILKLTTDNTRFKPRPDTSTVMAKRLLARALGIPSIASNRTENDRPRRGAARAK